VRPAAAELPEDDPEEPLDAGPDPWGSTLPVARDHEHLDVRGLTEPWSAPV
jgi:hypothetical protein